jgi:hypothetical protein
LAAIDDDDAERQAGNQPVAAREVAGARLPAERHFGKRCALRQDGIEQARVLGRIDAVLAAGQHSDRAGCETCLVRGRVDPAREPRHHDKARLAELARDHLREFEACARGVARADHRHHRPRQRRRIAADRDKRRRVVDHL